MMVDGDWRVAVYANRMIHPNEELFYDYRWEGRTEGRLGRGHRVGENGRVVGWDSKTLS